MMKNKNRIIEKKFIYSFQNFNLISDLTSMENVMLPNLYLGETKINAYNLAKSLLSRVGLENRTKS